MWQKGGEWVGVGGGWGKEVKCGEKGSPCMLFRPAGDAATCLAAGDNQKLPRLAQATRTCITTRARKI